MPTKSKTKTSRRDRLRLFLKGMQLHLLPLKTVTFGQVVHPVADLMAAIQADIDSSDAAEKGHADWIQLVDHERSSHASVDPIVSNVQQLVRVQFGNTEAAQGILADFGMAPHKKVVTTPKTKVASAQKAKATRALLHTAGPVQKKTAKAQAAQAPAPAEGTTPAPTGPTPAAAPATGGTTTPAKP